MSAFMNTGVHTDFSVFYTCILVLFLEHKLDRLVVHGPIVHSRWVKL
jgi:hypothetical protein